MTLASLVRHPHPARRVVRRDFDRIVDDLWSGFGLAPVAFAPSFPTDDFRASPWNVPDRDSERRRTHIRG